MEGKMLVLTRTSGEGIRIGDNVRVVVVEIKDNKVKLGIEAPQHLAIHRDEVYLRIQSENIEAARVETGALSEIAEMWKKK